MEQTTQETQKDYMLEINDLSVLQEVTLDKIKVCSDSIDREINSIYNTGDKLLIHLTKRIEVLNNIINDNVFSLYDSLEKITKISQDNIKRES